MSRNILELKNLTKVFKRDKAVDDITFSIRENSVFGLLGLNGAGKSTILKMIAGIMKPTEGEIIFNGKSWNRSVIKDIGALIEEPAIYPNLTARENLEISCLLHNLSSSRIDEVLEIIGLEDAGRTNYSMGMKQRLGLGIAIMHSLGLLILDEPTNGL